MSYRVIWSDLQSLLAGESVQRLSTTPFRRYCQLQELMFGKLDSVDNHGIKAAPPGRDYWGIESLSTEAQDYYPVSHDIDQQTSSLILGECNDAFRTEPMDVLLAVLVLAFGKSFPDRAVPSIFLEGHGREELDGHTIDLSNTVGWFTTLYPVQVAEGESASEDIVQLIRSAKDSRRRIPGKGLPYFASQRYSTNSDNRVVEPVEVVFNYAGAFQQLEWV